MSIYLPPQAIQVLVPSSLTSSLSTLLLCVIGAAAVVALAAVPGAPDSTQPQATRELQVPLPQLQVPSSQWPPVLAAPRPTSGDDADFSTPPAYRIKMEEAGDSHFHPGPASQSAHTAAGAVGSATAAAAHGPSQSQVRLEHAAC